MILRLIGSCALLGIVIGSSACTTKEVGCTLIGCDSFVEGVAGPLATTHAADLPITAELCIDGTTCRSYGVDVTAGNASCDIVPNGAPYDGSDCTVEPDGTVVLTLHLASGAYDGAHPVRLRVLDGAQTELSSATKNAVLTRGTPNGEACGPVCYQGSVDFTQ